MTAPDAGATGAPATEQLDSLGQSIASQPVAESDQAPDHLKDSVGNHIGGGYAAEQESPAAVIVEEELVPISRNAVAAIRDLTFRLSAPEASIGSRIRGLLP